MNSIEALDIIFGFFPRALLGRLKGDGLYEPILAGKASSGADLYDYLAPMHARLQDADYSALAKSMEPYLPGPSILEIGCGGGDLLARLKAKGFGPLYGIDRSAVMLAAARKRLGVGPEIRLTQARVEEFPFSSIGGIDAVIINNFWQLLPRESASSLLASLRACLSGKGLVLIGPYGAVGARGEEYSRAEETLRDNLGFVFSYPFYEDFEAQGYGSDRISLINDIFILAKPQDAGHR
jgi:SAM-dependent methyltransferase